MSVDVRWSRRALLSALCLFAAGSLASGRALVKQPAPERIGKGLEELLFPGGVHGCSPYSPVRM